jgi:threonine dehydrogenase-like Zn-dependent dehydrogenase
MDAILKIPWHDPLVQVAALVLVLAVIWMAVRMFVRIAIHVLLTGCGIILFLGLVLVIFRVFLRA